MLGRSFRRLCFVLAIASLGVWTVALAQDDVYDAPKNRSRQPASGWATQKPVDRDAAIEEKLKRILENQQLILQKADTVKQELAVVKVRVSMRRTRGDVVP